MRDIRYPNPKVFQFGNAREKGTVIRVLDGRNSCLTDSLDAQMSINVRVSYARRFHRDVTDYGYITGHNDASKGPIFNSVALGVRRFTNGAVKISLLAAQRNMKQRAVRVMRLATLRLSPNHHHQSGSHPAQTYVVFIFIKCIHLVRRALSPPSSATPDKSPFTHAILYKYTRVCRTG